MVGIPQVCRNSPQRLTRRFLRSLRSFVANFLNIPLIRGGVPVGCDGLF